MDVAPRRAAPPDGRNFVSTADPDAVGNWLNTNATSPLYDPAASSLAHSFARTDPAAAQVWANTIRDPALRAQVLSRLVR